MRVSFGQYNFSHQTGMTPTSAQKDVAKQIEYHLNPEYHCGTNYTRLLEAERKADIDVSLQRNGSFLVQVKKELPRHFWEKPKFYTPYLTSDKRKLRMTINPEDKTDVVEKKLLDFSNRCLLYVLIRDSKRNLNIEKQAQREYKKNLSEMKD